MQQNAVLAVLKILVLVAFTIFLGLDLYATQNLEEKVMRTRDNVAGLSEGVADSNRRVLALTESVEQARSAADRTHTRLDELLKALESGALRSVEGAKPTEPETEPEPDTATPVVQSTPTVIAGLEVYPRNPGWTVLCDKDANADPKRDLPVDRIDWDAVLHDYVSGEPKGLNYYSDDRTATVATIATYVADSLAERKTTDLKEWNALLAERIEESPDRRQYMIYLRKGVRWHRPALDLDDYPWLKKTFEVTAEDVRFTYEIIRDPNVGSSLAIYYEEIESIEVLDEHTLRVTWKRPIFYARTSTLDIRPMPSHIWACDSNGKRYDAANVGAAFKSHWFSKSVLGNGSYRFAEYKKGQYFRLERNENYWGQRATCREFYMHIITDDETRLNKFWNREVFSVSLGAEQYRRVILEEQSPHPVFKYEDYDRPAPGEWKTVYRIWPRPVYGGFAWNMRRVPFNDRKVRTAMTYALNRHAVVENLVYGLGEVIPIGESVFSFYFNKEIRNLPYDLDAAARLLEEAGWKDSDGDGIRDRVFDGERRDLEFELIIAATAPLQKSIAEMYRDDLLKIGVKLNALPADAALWSQKNAEFDFDGLIIFWYAGIDSDPRQLWDSKRANEPGSNNYCGYQDEEADRIFEKLVTTFDYPTRIKLHHRWYEIQFRDQPYTWIWSVHSAVVFDADWRVPEPKLDSPYVDRRLVFRWKDRP